MVELQEQFPCSKDEGGHTELLIEVICTKIFKRMTFLNGRIKSWQLYYLEIWSTMRLKSVYNMEVPIILSRSRWTSPDSLRMWLCCQNPKHKGNTEASTPHPCGIRQMKTLDVETT